MPYCWKCGTPLDEHARFCSKCGATVTKTPETKTKRAERRPTGIPAAILIAIILIAVITVAFSAIAFLPYKTVGPVSVRELVPYSSGVNTLFLNLTADIARVNITFKDLRAEPQRPLIILNASAAARTGAFGSQDFLQQCMPTWQATTNGNVLTVTVNQDVDTAFWPRYFSLNVTFDILVDLSMRTNLSAKTSTGGVAVSSLGRMVLNSASLEAVTGGVEIGLTKDTVILGDISIRVVTGGAKLSWSNVTVTGNVQVSLETVTGGVDLAVAQKESLLGNVALKANATTGGITLAIDIKDNVGAIIESRATTGGIDVIRQVGFSGTEALLQSNNYPASRNFNASLQTTTGGIDIDAKYTP